MIYFTSDSTRPHPALMSSSLEHRLIPVGGGRFIETHFNIRQQVCPGPAASPSSSSPVKSSQFPLEISLWRQISNLLCLNWNIIKFSPAVFVRKLSKHKLAWNVFTLILCFSSPSPTGKIRCQNIVWLLILLHLAQITGNGNRNQHCGKKN